jgi:hypothetical protein
MSSSSTNSFPCNRNGNYWRNRLHFKNSKSFHLSGLCFSAMGYTSLMRMQRRLCIQIRLVIHTYNSIQSLNQFSRKLTENCHFRCNDCENWNAGSYAVVIDFPLQFEILWKRSWSLWWCQFDALCHAGEYYSGSILFFVERLDNNFENFPVSRGNVVAFRIHAPHSRSLLLDIFANAVTPREYLTKANRWNSRANWRRINWKTSLITHCCKYLINSSKRNWNLNFLQQFIVNNENLWYEATFCFASSWNWKLCFLLFSEKIRFLVLGMILIVFARLN